MARDTGIAARLRAAGLKVEEVAGWKVRGSSTFDPRGLVYHHTAGSRTGNAPSLGICVNGRTGLPGPLCHVLIGRDNTCFVVAAGKANHAGLGGWNGLVGNSSVYGIEHENVGTTSEPWRPDQIEVAARAARALMDGRPVDKVCLHKEWAPRRKVDPHSISGHQFRAAVAATTPVVDPNPKDDPFMALSDKQQSELLNLVRNLEARSKETFEDISGNGRLKEVTLSTRELDDVKAVLDNDARWKMLAAAAVAEAIDDKLDAILTAVQSK